MKLTERIKIFIKLFLVSTFCALMFRLFVVEDYRIVSNSMFPTLLVGDLTFVSKSAFNIRVPFSSYEVIKFDRPGRGEIVAFTLPDKGVDTFVKRVVGIEGDKIQVKNHQLLVNGQPLQYSDSPMGTTLHPIDKTKFILETNPAKIAYTIQVNESVLNDYGPVDVPKGHFFAMGDNRGDSVDSRMWGPVPYSCLKGRLAMVWLSLTENGAIRFSRFGTLVR